MAKQEQAFLLPTLHNSIPAFFMEDLEKMMSTFLTIVSDKIVRKKNLDV